MTKKNFVAKMENANGVKFNENTKSWEMTKSKFNDFMNRAEFSDIKIYKSEKNENVLKLAVKNTVLGYVTIKTTNRKPKTEKTETKTTATRGNGHKLKNDNYIVKFKTIDGKENEKTDITTRNDLVAWLKTQSRKNMEYIHIYDSEMNVCRRSAWYDKKSKVANG